MEVILKEDVNKLGHRGDVVKVADGYEVAASGLAAGIFCQNPEGRPYVGFVWPGRTWFPDYSLPEGRAWWAGYARQFRDWGFGGAWIDMNDPSTGAAEVDDMRFQHGRWDHWTYHNLYATGMAQATWEGFKAAVPDERPFILSRSAATGSWSSRRPRYWAAPAPRSSDSSCRMTARSAASLESK